MATVPAVPTGRPALPVLAAFAGIVVFGGGNFVAAHFSNQELPPVFGAGVRFAAAALLFMALVDPILSFAASQPNTTVQTTFDEALPSARYLTRAHYLDEISDAATETIAERVEGS